MSYGDQTWYAYPWGTSGATTVTMPTWQFGTTGIYSTSGSYYDYNWPVAQQEAERPSLPESAMDWLRRRVTEITDLAYAGV